MDDWWLFFAVGFGAQLVDGALGMAFGVLSNTALLAIGLPPAHASALVHAAEIFTTSASAASHIYHRNVDWRLIARLGVTGVLGAILGAWILSNIEVSAARRYVYIYLLIMGLYILWKSVRIALTPRAPAGWTAVLGFGAGFLDATGGGGWGPMTTSTLVGSGHAPRYSVGSVNTAEFFVTVAAATTFFAELGAVAARTSYSAGSRRRAGGAVRRLDRQARPGARPDDRGRMPDRAGFDISAAARVSSYLGFVPACAREAELLRFPAIAGESKALEAGQFVLIRSLPTSFVFLSQISTCCSNLSRRLWFGSGLRRLLCHCNKGPDQTRSQDNEHSPHLVSRFFGSVRWRIEGRDIQLGPFAGYHTALKNIVHAFCDIRRVVADALDVLCTEKKMHAEADIAGVFHHVCQQLTKRCVMQSVDVFVAFPDVYCLAASRCW